MTGDGRHPTDLLDDRLDGRLDATRQAAFDEHIAQCDACRLELAALEWTRNVLASTAGDEPLPDGFDHRLGAALDAVDAEAGAAAAARPWVSRPATWWWATAAAAILLVIWIGPWTRPAHVPAAVAADLQAFSAGTLALDAITTAPGDLEAAFRASTLDFPVRVFDFGMMNIALAGGGVHRVGEVPSALMAYRGADGAEIICQMYRGTTADLPDAVDRRRRNEIDFFVYREGGATLVFWQEGDVVCVLASTGDPEAAVELAVAKAVRT